MLDAAPSARGCRRGRRWCACREQQECRTQSSQPAASFAGRFPVRLASAVSCQSFREFEVREIAIFNPVRA